MAGTMKATKRKYPSPLPEPENPGQHMVVYDLVHSPQDSYLQYPDHMPVKIEGLTMIENKYICVCVTIAKALPDGSQQLIRRELLKTEYFKKRWPQMLIKFYESQTIVNDIKLPSID